MVMGGRVPSRSRMEVQLLEGSALSDPKPPALARLLWTVSVRR